MLSQFLASEHFETIKLLLRNPNNHITVYLPEILLEEIPGKIKRRNLHFINSDEVNLKDYLVGIAELYEKNALIAPESVFSSADLIGFEGYKLASDKLMSGEEPVRNESNKYIGGYLTSVSFGLLGEGSEFAAQYLDGELAFDSETGIYYVDRDFVLTNLLKKWTENFRALLEIKKAA